MNDCTVGICKYNNLFPIGPKHKVAYDQFCCYFANENQYIFVSDCWNQSKFENKKNKFVVLIIFKRVVLELTCYSSETLSNESLSK